MHQRVLSHRRHLEQFGGSKDFRSHCMLVIAQMLRAKEQHAVCRECQTQRLRSRCVNVAQVNTVDLSANGTRHRRNDRAHKEPTVAPLRPTLWFCQRKARRSKAPIMPFNTSDTTASTNTMANNAS